MNTLIKLSLVIVLVATGCGGQSLPKESFPPKRLKLGTPVPKFKLLDKAHNAVVFEAPYAQPLIILSTKIGFEYDLKNWLNLIETEIAQTGIGCKIVIAVRAPVVGLSVFAERLDMPHNLLSDIIGCERLKKYLEANELLARERIIRLDDTKRADEFVAAANEIKNDMLTRTPGLADSLALVSKGPHVVLISKTGELIGQLDGPADSDRPEQLKKLLAKLAPADK